MKPHLIQDEMYKDSKREEEEGRVSMASVKV